MAEEATSEDMAPPAKGPKKKLMLIIAASLVLLGGGGAAWYFTQPQPAEKKAGEVKESAHAGAAVPTFMTLETFTVNLVPDPGEQYLQTDISLQLSDAKQEAVIKQFMPLVKAQILMSLSSKRSSEIVTIEGKNQLSKEITEMINKLLPASGSGAAPAISGVFFTSFIIQ
ncbi:hypothetical protein MTYP_03233 [Methylophilaceae bacterium]|nr:hypothetical protein MTYP_03233 [Methylophilaceae bacterium]